MPSQNQSKNVYDALADALDNLPNGFPRTDSKIELKVLSWIFSEEEARIGSHLGREKESYEDIAERVGLESETARDVLSEMAKRKLLEVSEEDGVPHYRLAPWIVGIY